MGSSRNVRRLSALTPSPSHRRSPLSPGPLSLSWRYSRSNGFQGRRLRRPFQLPGRRPSQVIARESETEKEKRNGNRMPEQFATAAFSPPSPRCGNGLLLSKPASCRLRLRSTGRARICFSAAWILTFGEFLKYGGPKKEATPQAPLFTSWGGSYMRNRRPDM